MVIAVYHGGAHKGCVTIPEGTNRSGWSSFTKVL